MHTKKGIMKTSKLFIVAVLIASSTFAFSTAHAATTAKTTTTKTTSPTSFFSGLSNVLSGFFTSGGASYPIPSAGTSPGGTSLPIDNNVWILAIAASAIGFKVVTRKTRALVKAN